MMEVMMTTGDIIRAKSSQTVTTNKPTPSSDLMKFIKAGN